MTGKIYFELKGKTALVTGSARGLGKEIAIGFARNGASLIVADIAYPEETTRAIKDLRVQCMATQTDISDEAQIKQMVEKAVSEFGKVDILINNAGISQLTYTPTEDLSVEEWDNIIRVNLRGTFLCCKHIGKMMIEGGGGAIVNIASTAGITGVPRAPAYCASKAGIILLIKSLALEWAKHNIRVNAIAPHYLETELTEELRSSEKIFNALVRQIPLGRFAKTAEIVDLILLMSTEASSYMTGTTIPVDGGYLA